MKGADFAPGTYTLVLRDRKGLNRGEPVEVSVKDAPSGPVEVSVTGFSVVSPAPITDRSSVRFSLSLECTSGYFSDAYHIVIFPDAEGLVSSVDSKSAPYFYLGAGQSETKTFDVDLSSLEYGKYLAKVYASDGKAASQIQAKFELVKDVSTGLFGIESDSDGEEIIYDLYGRRHSRPLAPGIYIINGVKTLVK